MKLDPAQIVLKDKNGEEMHGEMGTNLSPVEWNILFRLNCFSSEGSKFVVRGATVDGNPVEVPTVRITRGSAYLWRPPGPP